MFGELKKQWSLKGLGTTLCGNAALHSTHAMFANDTTLFASSKKSLITMITHVKVALATHGPHLNFDKCLIQRNSYRARVQPIEIDCQPVAMVSAAQGCEVLGTELTLLGRCSAEVKARMAAAWGKFHSLKHLLGKLDSDLHKRLRLFDTCVTQIALWCSESWLPMWVEKQPLVTTEPAITSSR